MAGRKKDNTLPTVAAQSNGNIVLTLKGGRDSASWVVIHAQNLDEAADYLSPENGPKLLDLMKRATRQ